MKRILLIAMLLLSAIAGAQIVDIPNALFKSKLTSQEGVAFSANVEIIDINNDGEIQVSEALEVTELVLHGALVNSVTGIEAFTNLVSLDLSDQLLTSLDVTALVNLEYLDCGYNPDMTTLNVDGLSNLIQLRCSYNNLSQLDLTGLESLELLYCDHNALEALDVSGLSNVSYIGCNHNQLSELDCDGLLHLDSLKFNHNNIESIDLSGCPELTYIDPENNPLSYLNIKNGIDTSTLDEAWDWGPFLYMCADEIEISDFINYWESPENFYISSYCSGVPGGSYNTIAGTVTFDADNNGCAGSDPWNDFVKITINEGTVEGATYTNLSGEYNFYTQAGTFTLTPEFENDWFTVTPASATVTLATVDNGTTTENFCITPNGVHPDVEVIVHTMTPAQPGFDAKYKIVYRNNGNQVLSGDVYFSYDDTVLDYISALPVEDNVSGSTLGWAYTDLMPFETRSAIVTLNVNGPMETPAVNIDDVLVFSASATPTVNDETPDNNSVVYNETVVGSYDPNDKTCLEGAAITPEMIGEYLHYNINFENTGTAPATFIVVKDVINPEQFDISTLQVIDASHDMAVKVEGNKVEFRFDAIDLGPLEKGNVLFKVKTLGTLQVNDEVSNYADIFFDYNFPITTNEATSTFQVLGTDGFTRDNSVKVYPNPSKGIVTVAADSMLTSVTLYDLQGRLLHTAMPNYTETILNIADRAAGVYFIKVTSEKGSKVEKIIKE